MVRTISRGLRTQRAFRLVELLLVSIIISLPRKLFVGSVVSVATIALTARADAQQVPNCPQPGMRLVAWHTIASQGRTYALFEYSAGLNQQEAVRFSFSCRWNGKPGYLVEFGHKTPFEWQAVRSRFGGSLGGPRNANIWVAAGRQADHFVRWFQTGESVRNISDWGAWAPNEPQHKTGVTFHAGHPGLFNSCSANDRYTRFMVEFR